PELRARARALLAECATRAAGAAGGVGLEPCTPFGAELVEYRLGGLRLAQVTLLSCVRVVARVSLRRVAVPQESVLDVGDLGRGALVQRLVVAVPVRLEVVAVPLHAEVERFAYEIPPQRRGLGRCGLLGLLAAGQTHVGLLRLEWGLVARPRHGRGRLRCQSGVTGSGCCRSSGGSVRTGTR